MLCFGIQQNLVYEQKDPRSAYKKKRKVLDQSAIDSLSLKIANQTLKLPFGGLFLSSFFDHQTLKRN